MSAPSDNRPDGRRGRLVVVSAPSGAGKSTLCRQVIERLPDLAFSVSYTTRAARPGETPGVDYHFVAREVFEAGIAAGRWVEWARVHGNYYGTCSQQIEAHLQQGRSVLMDIDTQGMQQIRRRYPDSMTVFILPPSEAELRRRLVGRGTDDRQTVERRLEAARAEMALQGEYDYRVVNDRVAEAVDRLTAIVAGAVAAG